MYQRDYWCHWRRNARREWRQAAPIKASSALPCAHTCMTQTMLWQLRSDFDQHLPRWAQLAVLTTADETQTRTSLRGLRVCEHKGSPQADTRPQPKKPNLTQFAHHEELGKCSQVKTIFWRVTVRGYGIKIWNLMSSSIWLYIWKMEAESSLSMVVFTPSSQLKQACFCWTAIITACQFAHYWKCAPVLFIMSRAHGNSAPWFKIAAFLWCRSQNLADYWQAEQFLYIDANFLGSLQGLMKNPRDHVKLKLPLRPWTGNPTKSSVQDGRDRNPILHWRENWRPNKLEGKRCRTAMHHRFLHFVRKKKVWQRHGLLASFHSKRPLAFTAVLWQVHRRVVQVFFGKVWCWELPTALSYSWRLA